MKTKKRVKSLVMAKKKRKRVTKRKKKKKMKRKLNCQILQRFQST